MNIFGLTIARTKQLQTISSSTWWVRRIFETFAGAWQQNVEVVLEDVLRHPTVFACFTLIASDVAKMRVKLVQEIENDIWDEIENPSFSPVLRKPNSYQTRIAFYMLWVLSKLIAGNTYVLKQRDARGVVVAEYILDPNRVRPLVSPDGSVFYELNRDNLSRQPDAVVVVPAREIIHDVMYPLEHPLVGVGPLHAAGLAAMLGVKIQNNSTTFQANGSNPGGVVLVPGAIEPDAALRLKEQWETNYGGANAGRVAVLSDGMKYEPMKLMSAVDSQVVEQLNWSDLKICGACHVPPYMVAVGPMPTYDNIQALNTAYYQQCLQILVESIELLQDEGLGLAPDRINGRRMGTEFDLDNLLRMDTAALVAAEKEAVLSGLKSPNEGRRNLNLMPVVGGDSPMMQQQQFSLAALAERDRDQPFSKPAAPSAATPAALPAATPEEKRFDLVALQMMVKQKVAELRRVA